MAKVLVLGRGRSGSAAASLLAARGREVEFADGFDEVVVSPGIPVKSELQLGCEELKRKGWKLLAVTGSKGKSSVVKVVADALNLAGRHAVPCGNYGVAVSSVADESPDCAENCWAVVEVSSFQLETTMLTPDAFEAAVVLNLQEDHLDRHGTVEIYHSLKRRLLGYAKKSLDLSLYDSEVEMSSAAESFAGSYFDNAILRMNGYGAAFLMTSAGVPAKMMARAFREFVPLPHRMADVAKIDGVLYVDDSKATSLAALEAGVVMAANRIGGGRRVLLVAGGLPKGDDPKKVLSVLTKWVKKVYLIGQSAESFNRIWNASVDCEVCGTLERAVDAAKRDAVNGDVVLLSPGAASFDQFSNFGERGDVFATLAKKGKTR